MKEEYSNLIDMMRIIETLDAESVFIKLSYHTGYNHTSWWHCEISETGDHWINFELSNSEECLRTITQIKNRLHFFKGLQS